MPRMVLQKDRSSSLSLGLRVD